jgi:hypothetical protein
MMTRKSILSLLLLGTFIGSCGEKKPAAEVATGDASHGQQL